MSLWESAPSEVEVDVNLLSIWVWERSSISRCRRMIGFRGCSVANPELPPSPVFLSYITPFHSLVALTWWPTSLDLISNMIRSEGAAAATKHIAPPSPLVAFAVRHFRQETCDMGYEGYDYDLGFFVAPVVTCYYCRISLDFEQARDGI